MQLQTQSVGLCQLKPDIHVLSQTLKCHTIHNIKHTSAPMASFSKSSEAEKITSKQNHSVQKMKMLLVEDSKLLRDIIFDAISQLGNVEITSSAVFGIARLAFPKSTSR